MCVSPNITHDTPKATQRAKDVHKTNENMLIDDVRIVMLGKW